MALLDLIRLHAGEASDIDSFLALWDQREAEEVEKTDSASDDLAREDTPDQDRVVISTMHASKGREYEAVVIFDYAADLGKLTDGETEEERRVFYVGMTRAQDSLLITIDSNKPPHRFVCESIAPALAEERLKIGRQQASLYEQGKQATNVLTRARARLTKIADGREMARLEQELAQAREREAELTAKLTDLREWLDGARIWDTISGRKRRTEQEMVELQEGLVAPAADVSRLDDEVTFLRADSLRYQEPFERKEADAVRRLSDLDREARSLVDRLSQLELCPDAPHEPTP